jgi:hypothetical protein
LVTNEDTNNNEPVLRPLIARLKEIERKCDSMGTRNEEFPLMKERLVSIIARLEAGQEQSGEPLAYRDMARELFPVAHLFESVGFMSVGKEIAHVERSLQNLAPEPIGAPEPVSTVHPSTTSSAAVSPPPDSPDEEPSAGEETEDKPSGEGIPKPILAAFLVLVISVAVAGTIIFRVRQQNPVLDPTPALPTPVVLPSPSPDIQPTQIMSGPNSTKSASERLADALAQARQSIDAGDVDGAVGYLAFAELIDRNDPRVVEVADRIVDQLVEEANEAAAEERWEDAARHTAHARTVAKRFGLDTGRISDAERDHFEMQQFTVVSPEEIQILRASIGKHVDVMLIDGSMFSGWLTGFKGSVMILDVEDDVGGGVVSFTDEIPLDTIDWIRIREN